MSPVRVGFACLIVLLSGCKESLGPRTGPDLVRVVPNSPTFTLATDGQGRGVGDLEVEVMNQSDYSLFVFKACAGPVFGLEKESQGAWLEVEMVGQCLIGWRAEEIPPGKSRLYSLGVLTSGPPAAGTYRVDLDGLSWVSDFDEYFEAQPLSPSYRLSDEFQILVEGDGTP